jgi:multisubunit Na+/H+ antiporter MnhE subunit
MAADQAHRVGTRGALRAWLVWFVLLTALWVLLIDNHDPADLALGAVCGAVAATATVLVRAQRRIVLRFRARWLRALPPALWSLLADLPEVAWVVWRRGVLRRDERGRLVEVPFRAIGDDPEVAARRVLAVTLGSLAPGTVVVGVDGERRVLVAHQLVASGDARRAADPVSAVDDEGAR